MPVDVCEFMVRNPYPGRVIGFRSARPGHLEGLMMLTGRSPASKARALDPIRNGNVVLQARATDDGPHDELRHYPAVIADNHGIVIANGDHSVPLHAALADARLDSQIAATRYEPDPPINTSRISVVLELRTQRVIASVNAAATTDRDAAAVLARFDAHAGDLNDWIMLSTYQSDGTIIEPNYQFTRVAFSTGDPLAEAWEAADPRYRVAAAAITFENGTAVAETVFHTGAADRADHPVRYRTEESSSVVAV
ncbi:IMP cyclohydrolase [Nocardia sp. NPDC101769]|uniref:IMP cyclohydrolase n=1 Tax=Nocardia sp. NPDC101769 TaxID=3364333 RepID=UPI0038161408